MKKIILLLVFSSGFFISGFAQQAGFGNFNLGIYGALPILDMRALFNQGVGGSLKYEYNLSHNINYLKKSYVANKIYITLEGGYESFAVKTNLQNAYVPSTYSYIPVKIGLKYYILKGLYAEPQYGTANYAQHGGGHRPDYSAGIGYAFNSGFEFSVRYEEWQQYPQKHLPDDYGQTGPFAKVSNFNQMEIRLAERF